jgi:hypothetical protein
MHACYDEGMLMLQLYYANRIALCILLSISIPKWFGDFKAKHARHHDEEKRRESMNTMTTGNGTDRY